MTLPIVRSSERVTYKRCQTKWYWSYRKGLVPRSKKFGALELGTWIHEAQSKWYLPGFAREGLLGERFATIADSVIEQAALDGAPEYVLEKAEELAELGLIMCQQYQAHYGYDKALNIVGTEVPLEFEFPDWDGNPVARHIFKPDAIYQDRKGGFWILETKTATTIKTGHLSLDDQARPYGAMAERAMREAGIMSGNDKFEGMMYNFMRKGLPDERETNSKGQALNKDGSVSKRQPNPLFLRYPVKSTRAGKAATLNRLRGEVVEIARLGNFIRKTPNFQLRNLHKTPHTSCERFCDYFEMCKVHEEGTDIRGMQRSMYRQENPYEYAETTDDEPSFEMG